MRSVAYSSHNVRDDQMVKSHATEKGVQAAAKLADAVEIDITRKMIRAKKRFLSTSLMLRDVVDTVEEADILALFEGASVPKPVAIKKEVGM